MTERRRHKKPESIWLFDYESLSVLDNCPQWLVLLSERDINIIWQSVLNIDKFRSRVFTDVQGDYYTRATMHQWGDFKEWVSDLNVNMGDFMACNELLERMTVALEGLLEKSCCPSGGTGAGSRGTGGTQVPENTYNQQTSGGNPPPGFASNAAWKSNMCNAAQDIINALGADLQGLSGISYSAQSPSGLAALLIGILLTPVPFDDIIGLAGYLIFTGYNYALLSTMSGEISANNENLLCILYNSNDAQAAKSDFFDELQTIATNAFTSQTDAEWVMGAIDWFITNDAFNKLFEPGPTVSQDADCSSCPGAATWVLWIPSGQSGEWGTIEIDGLTLTGSSEVGDDCNRLNIRFTAGSIEPSQLAHIDVISTTGATHTTGYDFYRPEGETEYLQCPSSDCQNTQGENVYEYLLCSNTSFSLYIEWSIP